MEDIKLHFTGGFHAIGAADTLLAVCIHELIFGLLANSFWISSLYGSPYVPLLLTRIIQYAVIIPVQIIVIRLIGRFMGTYGKRLLIWHSMKRFPIRKRSRHASAKKRWRPAPR